MKIYTKTGDEGTTGILGSQRLRKDDARIEAYGTVDELNAALGVARASALGAEEDALAARLQDDLFVLGAALADPNPQGPFHNQITDPQVAQQALKNLAIIGGLLMVFAYGQVRGTLGSWRERDRAHDAEVRAAHAEGRAEGAEHVATHDTAVVHEERPVDRPRL